ncbi:hypothetical protein [Propionicimonas sp.]|uniref:hypothetical protein n=1 Tax=Propionicimonas sp. TaxID=1955623 RepID=UPI001E16E77B|nr:hypothetical protein [Propionicimonas sp.]MBU3977701.1 hypothetical protein [Actinomycetota bacterium]MBU3987175.1 hypothetical protein [Actinomycetota bacterium]MBU4008996.1 hypothetical protein [Actinomycetota bacterium]MBU4065854.1 hypothetical protein [Actinomycetota bacterium]MBU4093302.1 hypothetical protein [Actinomycetota bacterium]
MNFRRIIATVTITGAIMALPITLVASNGMSAGGVGGTSKIITIQGGQGNWPLK